MCYQNKRRQQAMTNNFTLNYNVTGNDRKRLADKWLRSSLRSQVSWGADVQLCGGLLHH